MEENEKTVEQESMSPEEVLVKMKETMVPKEEANKWQKKYNDLFQSVANGTFSGEDKKGPTEEELKKQFIDNVTDLGNSGMFMSDREQIQKLLEFDDYLTSHGRNSCFLPKGSEIKNDDIESAKKVRAFLETAVSRESDAQMASWTADHLDEPMSTGSSKNDSSILRF